MERFIIIGFGRRELTPEEIEEYEAFIKSLREKEAAEKKLVDDLKLLTDLIMAKIEPLKKLPELPESPKHWNTKINKNVKHVKSNYFYVPNIREEIFRRQC